MTPQRLLSVVSIGFPLLDILLGLPLALRLVPPNHVFGFRAPPAFDSPEAWYSVNATLGYCLLGAAVISLLLLFVVANRMGGAQASERLPLVIMGNTMLTVAAVVVCIALSRTAGSGR
jgi:hypothetical protein